MTSGGHNFNDFLENQLTISCSINSIKAIPNMLCIVTIHALESRVGGQKCMVPLNLLIGGGPVPTGHGPFCSAADSRRAFSHPVSELADGQVAPGQKISWYQWFGPRLNP